MADKTEAEAKAILSQTPFALDIKGVPGLALPDSGGAWDYKQFPELMDKPRRKKGTVTLHEVSSFIEYVQANKQAGCTNIYMDVNYAANEIRATAVFNDHGAESAGWSDHRAVFVPRQGNEWAIWTKSNKSKFAQADLAAFLETNIRDINPPEGSNLPTGSDVLTFVSRLEETRTVKYGSAVNIQNGMVQLEFTEQGDDATKGKLELFKEFGIGISPFFGAPPYALRAFLRYRIDRNTAEIVFWYELQKPEKVLEDACRELIESIKKETGVPMFYASAPGQQSIHDR